MGPREQLEIEVECNIETGNELPGKKGYRK